MYIGLHIKCPLFLSHFNETWNLLDRFFKNSQISNLIKISPVGTELFHVVRQANGQEGGHDEAKSHFSQICECA